MRAGSVGDDPCGVDVWCNTSSRGVPVQHLMSLHKVVTVINKHPNGAIQHRQVGEASEAGHWRDQRKIIIDLNCTARTVEASVSTIRALCRWRLLLNWDTAEGAAQVGGEISERAGSDGEEDDAAFRIDRL